METAKKLLLFGDEGLSKFTKGDGFFLDEFDYPQIDAENLLKAPDDLTNSTYWSTDGVTPTEPSTGIFRLTKTAVVDKYIAQIFTNWVPNWAGCVSVIVSVQSDDLTAMSVALLVDGVDAVDSAEVISGNASVAVASSIANITSIDGSLSKVRITGSVKSWATSVAIRYYPDKAGTTAGYVETSLSQVILGDQPSEKPRPIAQETAYPMMAYRPNWRLTKDSGARTYVTDTEGLIWCGEATDIKIAPANGSSFNCDAGNFEVNFSFTFETTKSAGVYVSHQDDTHCLRVLAEGGAGLRIWEMDGGSNSLFFEAGVFTDGEFYRVRFKREGTALSLYVDDKKYGTDLTSSKWLTDDGGEASHSLATNDMKIVTEPSPKAPGLIVAGGKASPGYGDPGIWYTQPDGSAFSTAAGTAMLLTPTFFDISKTARFGLDSNTLSSVTGAAHWMASANELYVIGKYGDVIDDPVNEVERSLMVLQRSDTHGYHYLDHQSGKEWKLNFAWTGVEIGAGSAYPAFTNYDSPSYLKRMALLNLSSWVAGDFAEVTDTKTNPPNLTQFDCNANFHMTWSFTIEDGKFCNLPVRAFDDNSEYLRLNITNSRVPKLQERELGGSNVTLYTGPAMTDAASYKFDLVGNGSSVQFYIDNVLKADVITAVLNENEGGSVSLDLVTNDLVLTTHPNPALGLATDRWIAPEQYKESDLAPANIVMVERGVQVPGASAYIFFRGWSYSGPPYCYGTRIQADGELRVTEYPSVTRIDGNPGDVTDDDDVMTVADGTDLEAFVEGASIGSYGSALYGTNTGAKMHVNNRLEDSTEFWRSRYNLPFKL